jgi:O-antigen/teichoic acid export membrane protein
MRLPSDRLIEGNATMDSRQTAWWRRAVSAGTHVVRPATSALSRTRSGKIWGKKRDLAVALTTGVGESRHFGSWSSPSALIDRVRRDSLLRNSLFIMSTAVVNSAFGFVFWLLVARLFAAQVVGVIAAITAASSFVVLLASLGVGGMLIQSLPEQEKPAGWSLTFWAGMATAVATSLVIGCTALLLLPLIAEQLAVLHSAAYATVFAVATVALSVAAILDYVFIAERAAGNMLGRNSVAAAGKVFMTVLFAFATGTSGLNLLGAWAAASMVGLLLGIGLLTRRVSLLRPPRPSVLASTARGLLSRLAGNQLIGMGGALLPYLLPVLVTARLSASDNAYFYTTWMTAGVFLIIAPAVSQSLFAEGAHSPNDLRVKARSALAVIGAILGPGIVGGLVLGGIVLSAFGPAYAHHATGLLRIVLLASMPDAINGVYVSVLRVRGRFVVAAALNLGMAVGTVALSWALLPVLGISAVGWAFLAMQLGGCAFVVLDLLRQPTLVGVEANPRYEETV